MSESDKPKPKHEVEAEDRRNDEIRAGDDLPDEDDLPQDEDLPEGALDDVDVKDLLRGALRPPPGSVAPSLLGGVQKKLRARSRGKFYGDGWSTARSPRSTYLITSLVMLVLMLLVFAVLVPWSSATVP